MRKDLLIIALGLSLAAGSAVADVLAVPEEDPAGVPAVTLPAKGSTMAEVRSKYGEPRTKQPTVGGDSPKHPPITRWDYDGFLVIFERDRVVDAVIPGAPPKVYHKDRLQPATAIVMPPVAPPPMPEPAPEAAPMIPEAAPTDEIAPEAENPPEGAMGEPIPESAARSAEPEMSETPADLYGAEAPAEATPENPYPDRPTPAEAPAEDAP